MKLIRLVLGALILFLDRVFAPTPVRRPADKQAQLEAELRGLALYQFEACPFCVKVRRAMKRLDMPIELRDARKVPAFGEELVREGGMMQVPCLRITEGGNSGGKARWLYESSDIIAHLEALSGRFA